MKLGGCKTGKAKITGAYKFPCRYVIHTVGPKWKGGKHGEEELLRACYYNSLMLAVENSCKSIAFPLISAGVYGYPKEEVIRIAQDVINGFVKTNNILVYLVLFE